MRREHADESAWKEYLAELGMDPQSFKAELRAQHTVAALLEQEVEALPVPQGAEATGPEGQRQAVHDALLGRLRGRARIELLL
jgi:LPS sulfotransferase NodH